MINFYCSWLSNSLSICPVSEDVGVSLPVSSKSISNLLRLLGSGTVISCSREELEDMKATAEVWMVENNDIYSVFELCLDDDDQSNQLSNRN